MTSSAAMDTGAIVCVADKPWQMDFKGHFAMFQGRCHVLTVLDDHSRFNVVLHAGNGETFENVQVPLEQSFRRYGPPSASAATTVPATCNAMTVLPGRVLN